MIEICPALVFRTGLRDLQLTFVLANPEDSHDEFGYWKFYDEKGWVTSGTKSIMIDWILGHLTRYDLTVNCVKTLAEKMEELCVQRRKLREALHRNDIQQLATQGPAAVEWDAHDASCDA